MEGVVEVLGEMLVLGVALDSTLDLAVTLELEVAPVIIQIPSQY